MRDKSYKILIFIFCLLFIIDAFCILFGFIQPIDQAIYSFLRSFSNKFVDSYFIFFTYLGNWQTISLVLIALHIILKYRDKISMDSVVLLSVCSNSIIKHIVCRPRPDILRLVKIGGYSFPSGHSMIAITLYGFLFALVTCKIKKKWLRLLLQVLLVCLIFNICISRIYVGVHYASDVFGGFVLGFAELLLVLYCRRKYFGGDSDVQSLNK